MLVVALAWLSIPSFAAAQGPPRARARGSVGALFRLGLDYGGEEVIELSYSDGRSSTIGAFISAWL